MKLVKILREIQVIGGPITYMKVWELWNNILGELNIIKNNKSVEIFEKYGFQKYGNVLNWMKTLSTSTLHKIYKELKALE